jgi:hypothetical protein
MIRSMWINSPNVILKSRYPNYDSKVYPELYQLNSVDELNTLKESLNGNYYLQEFINNSNNQHEDKNGIIRSIDIIYGSNLDVINMLIFFCFINAYISSNYATR